MQDVRDDDHQPLRAVVTPSRPYSSESHPKATPLKAHPQVSEAGETTLVIELSTDMPPDIGANIVCCYFMDCQNAHNVGYKAPMKCGNCG